jgi:epoxyqueuosine reductase
MSSRTDRLAGFPTALFTRTNTKDGLCRFHSFRFSSKPFGRGIVNLVNPNALPDTRLDAEAVRKLAYEAGFIEAGVVGLPHANTARDAARFEQFIDEGRAGTMNYLARRNEQEELVRSQVKVPFPWARSIVVCMAGYNADAPLSTAPAEEGAGWIARYAWSGRRQPDGKLRPSDYHKVLLKRLRALESALRETYGSFESRAYVDTGPVVERSAARAAGLGWTGKNTCLIHPKLGSWNFLAVIVTSLELPAEQAPLTVPDRCGSCRRCLDACPTEALIAPYQMDATRCISYLTIEHKGEIGEELSKGMGRQVFGCDICQDVCPWNRKAPLGPDAEGEMTARRELINPDLAWLAELELPEFEALFNGSPVRRASFAGLRRNVAIAMGNSGLRRFLPVLERWERWVEDDAAHAAETGFDVVRTVARRAIAKILLSSDDSRDAG